MNKDLTNRKISFPYGILFQIPVLIIAILGLYELFEKVFYSFTNFNMLEEPSFVGFGNYINIFKDEVVLKCLGNTVIMVCVVAALLIVTAVLPAIFTAKLKLPFGLAVMGAFACVSICSMISDPFRMFFSGDRYGMLNSILIHASVIQEPIAFARSYAMLLSALVLWLYCLAPVFFITYVAARMKHSFLGAAIAVCLIPVLMYNGGGIPAGVVGFPSADHAADWLYTAFRDYHLVRFQVGYAHGIMVIGLMMLVVWCALVSAIVFGAWTLCKKCKARSTPLQVMGFVSFGLALLLFVVFAAFMTTHLARAYMPTEEMFVFPVRFLPEKPTNENFVRLAEMLSSFPVPGSRYWFNTLLAVPFILMAVCVTIALPSGVGFGLTKASKHQKMLLLCFVPFLFVSGYMTLSKTGMLNSYAAYILPFLSSFEFLLAVFLAYLAVKLVFDSGKPRVSNILLGSFFVLTSFYAIGVIRGIWCGSGDGIYNENLKTWQVISTYFSSGGVARGNVAAANTIMMLLVTLAVVAVPSVLLLVLYLSCRKKR